MMMKNIRLKLETAIVPVTHTNFICSAYSFPMPFDRMG